MAAAKPIPKEQKIVLGIIAAVGLFMFVKKAYLPQGKEIGKLKTEIAETNKKIEDINRKVAKMKEIKANFEILKLKVIEAEKQLPKSEELPELIRSITKLGEKHGISIDNFMIGSIMPQKYHQEHTYNFNIQSSYHNLAQFFVDVCQKERIMTVKDVRISPSASKENSQDMSATFTLIVYTYKD